MAPRERLARAVRRFYAARGLVPTDMTFDELNAHIKADYEKTAILLLECIRQEGLDVTTASDES